MKIALISEGQTGAEYPGRDGYDLVVAVNGMATLFEADWWACLDAPVFMSHFASVLGAPRLFTTQNTKIQIEQGHYKARGLQEAWARFSRDAVFTTPVDDQPPIPTFPPMPLDVPILSAGPRKGEPRFDQWGGLSALVCCWMASPMDPKNPADLDCYGCDYAAPTAVNGLGKPCAPNPERWKTETRIWNGLAEGFERAGDLRVRYPTTLGGPRKDV